eukprot:TRINITY_DN24584_c0_g1_i1.p1 TRINITY_DN24584_c0_g1~~TRINITY_DN24584_c0_g1_i1.p1  ORF type:complete len:350 (+),score=31.63 TRINITY_DN24584_c0_g1_i1:59-1108(+)
MASDFSARARPLSPLLFVACAFAVLDFRVHAHRAFVVPDPSQDPNRNRQAGAAANGSWLCPARTSQRLVLAQNETPDDRDWRSFVFGEMRSRMDERYFYDTIKGFTLQRRKIAPLHTRAENEDCLAVYGKMAVPGSGSVVSKVLHVKVGIDICFSAQHLRITVSRLGLLAGTTMRSLKKHLTRMIVASPGACASRLITANSAKDCPNFGGWKCSERCYIFEWTPEAFNLPVSFGIVQKLVRRYGVRAIVNGTVDRLLEARTAVATSGMRAESALKRFMIWNMGFLGVTLGDSFDLREKEKADRKERKLLEQRIDAVRESIREVMMPERAPINPETCSVVKLKIPSDRSE